MPIVYNAGNVVVLGEVTVEQHGIDHIPKFTGHIWFVDTSGDDDNDGISPHTAFATIGAAIAAASAGDAITVKAGIYDESGLDMSKTGLELWGGLGAVVVNSAGGAVLTVSGDYCRVQDVRLTQAGQIGLHVTGARGSFEEIESGPGNSVAYCVDGTANAFLNCHAGQPTATGFDVQANGNRLQGCGAIGADGATRGFYIHNNAARCRLYSCSSVGNGTSGFEIATGSNKCLIKDCASGSGDGRWIDADNASVWSNFTYDDEVYHLTTFTGTGAGSDNLFKVTGTAEIQFIFGHVETVLAADVGNLKIELYDGAATDITTVVNVSSAPVGSFIVKTEESTKALKYYSSAAADLIEKVEVKKSTFSIVQKAATDTFVRATWAGNAASGAIHWHCQWLPLTEEGWVETV